MFAHRFLTPFFMLVGILLALVLSLGDSARATGKSLATANRGLGPSTAFTYQGELQLDGAHVSGTYDFQFSLWDAASGGSQAGSTVSHADVTVDDGRFTVLLDFGDVFDGSSYYLQIAVRAGDSTGAYTTLSPRQALTATPYASHAGSAPWAGLQDVPPGFADGVDDVDDTVEWAEVSSLVGSGSEQVATGDHLHDEHYYTETELNTSGAGGQVHWNNLTSVPPGFADNVDGVQYANVIVVAKSGGDFTTIMGAVDNITDAAADNPYLVWVAPGVYEEQVTLKPYVTLEGSGEGATIVRGSGGTQNPLYGPSSATLVGADNATVRHLTVESDAASTTNEYAVAIWNNNASPTLGHVTATASGGDLSYGVYNSSASSPAMTNVTATASGSGSYNYGVYNDSSSSPTMTNVTATASGGNRNYGVVNENSSSPTMTNVTASASGGSYSYGVANVSSSSPTMTNVTATASGGSSNYGVANVSSSSPVMTNVTATATDGSSNYGVFNVGSSPVMTNVTATASDGSYDNYGVYSVNSSPVIRDSRLEGDTNSVYNVGTGTVQVANSQLVGTVYGGGKCYNNYDENLDPHTC